MARPQADVEAGRARLVDLVMDLIAETGGTSLTMTEIAARAGMATSSLYRYFESRDAVVEAVAERWFQPSIAIMEEVVESDLPPRRKMYEFFARRFLRLRAMWQRDPVLFNTHIELGEEHFETAVRSYIDLGDHYLGTIIAEAKADGHFAGIDIDTAISLANQMLCCYCNVSIMAMIMPKLSEDKLARIVDAMFDGLSASDRGARGVVSLQLA
jgi:AcrR family transcriptional regulator